MPPNTTTSLASADRRTSLVAVSDKQLVSDLLVRLPDDVSLQTIAKEVEFMAGVREGVEQLDHGQGVPIEAVEKMIASWTTK
jgi:hypothetical protein